MKVIVDNMEMPSTCHNCFCFDIVGGEIYCCALDSFRKDTHNHVSKWYRKMRRDDCPLNPMPECDLVSTRDVKYAFDNAILHEYEETGELRAGSQEIAEVLAKVPILVHEEGE